jgi:hypothetical protein
MNIQQREQVFATHKSELIPILPPQDRKEIVAQSMALSAGVRIAEERVNPLSADLCRAGVTFNQVMTALGQPPRAGITNIDLINTIQEAAQVILAERLSTPDTTHRQVCRLLTAKNFLPHAMPWPSPVALARVGEGGEIPPAAAGVSWQELARVESCGGTLDFTRQAILNAEWDLLKSIVEELTAAAYRLERESVYGLLGSNPLLTDNVAWFHASRGNVNEGAAGFVTSGELSSAMSRLRKMGQGGAAALNTAGRWLVVPPESEIRAAEILQGLLPSTFPAPSGILAAPELSAAWYLLPDPGERPVIGLLHLTKDRKPVIDTKAHFTADAIGVRCRFDFAVSPLSPFAIQTPTV